MTTAGGSDSRSALVFLLLLVAGYALFSAFACLASLLRGHGVLNGFFIRTGLVLGMLLSLVLLLMMPALPLGWLFHVPPILVALHFLYRSRSLGREG